MALIVCKECGREISDQANACPHCGYNDKASKKVKLPELPELKKVDSFIAHKYAFYAVMIVLAVVVIINIFGMFKCLWNHGIIANDFANDVKLVRLIADGSNADLSKDSTFGNYVQKGRNIINAEYFVEVRRPLLLSVGLSIVLAILDSKRKKLFATEKEPQLKDAPNTVYEKDSLVGLSKYCCSCGVLNLRIAPACSNCKRDNKYFLGEKQFKDAVKYDKREEKRKSTPQTKKASRRYSYWGIILPIILLFGGNIYINTTVDKAFTKKSSANIASIDDIVFSENGLEVCSKINVDSHSGTYNGIVDGVLENEMKGMFKNQVTSDNYEYGYNVSTNIFDDVNIPIQLKTYGEKFELTIEITDLCKVYLGEFYYAMNGKEIDSFTETLALLKMDTSRVVADKSIEFLNVAITIDSSGKKLTSVVVYEENIAHVCVWDFTVMTLTK